MAEPTARDRARLAYANALRAQGPAWANTAGLILTGFENLWITPALDAMEALVLLLPDDSDDDEGPDLRPGTRETRRA